MRSVKRYTIFDTTDFTKAAFTVTAATNVCTSNGHGLSDGNCVELKSATTLPAGLSAATPYYVISATTNTFKLSATKGGDEIDITDTGTGIHTWYKEGAGKSVNVTGLDYITIGIDTDGGGDAAMTFKVAVSNSETCPDFDKVQSVTNQYAYAASNNVDSGDVVKGSTGVAVAGADTNTMYSVNVDNVDWITVKVSGRTEGEVKIILTAIEE
jgi:hypothetical protein